MSETHRDINKIDAASSKPLSVRANPGNVVQAPATKVSGDNKPNTKTVNNLPATKSLTDK